MVKNSGEPSAWHGHEIRYEELGDTMTDSNQYVALGLRVTCGFRVYQFNSVPPEHGLSGLTSTIGACFYFR